ncbi:hypothetical protein MMC31_005661 [Peltigera leucophlebia]|nr:hypothetical protein [Peltigera leucophlebia]
MPAIPGVIQPPIRCCRTKKGRFTRQAKAKVDRLAQKNLDPINLDPNACPNLLFQLTDDLLSSREEKAEQSAMINRLPHGKAIVLNGENNHKDVQLQIATGSYMHLFTSPEIALFKQFKNIGKIFCPDQVDLGGPDPLIP